MVFPWQCRCRQPESRPTTCCRILKLANTARRHRQKARACWPAPRPVRIICLSARLALAVSVSVCYPYFYPYFARENRHPQAKSSGQSESQKPQKTAIFEDFSERQRTGKWRMGWDSNPRDGLPPAGFQDRCLQPLGHPSAIVFKCRIAEAAQ